MDDINPHRGCQSGIAAGSVDIGADLVHRSVFTRGNIA
jgi:hypothetical protein